MSFCCRYGDGDGEGVPHDPGLVLPEAGLDERLSRIDGGLHSMNCRDVRDVLRDLPCMTLEQAETITTFISTNAVKDILELGFNHGVSTCYMAAALSEAGRGSIVTIDLEAARKMTPNVEELLERIGERHRVQVFYEPTSYIWRMMKFLEDNPAPRFDLCNFGRSA